MSDWDGKFLGLSEEVNLQCICMIYYWIFKNVIPFLKWILLYITYICRCLNDTYRVNEHVHTQSKKEDIISISEAPPLTPPITTFSESELAQKSCHLGLTDCSELYINVHVEHAFFRVQLLSLISMFGEARVLVWCSVLCSLSLQCNIPPWEETDLSPICWWTSGMPVTTGIAVSILACVPTAQSHTFLWSTSECLGSHDQRQSLRWVL